MGVVYQARQVSLNRLVALKMILAGGHAGAEHRARFRSEAEAVARLQHPHIVQIYEVGEQDGRPYFSLELMDGGNLDRRLNGTPQPARQAAQLVETLARATQAAHDRGIVHRDLKPGNVLLTADGTPKITDFGLAKHLQSDAAQTASGAIMGTPSYMAPEQARGKSREAEPRTDVYALGAILYELLTGRPPFKAATTFDTLMQVISEEPVPPSRLQPTLPRDLETICLKCLEKEPARRYATAETLAEDLRRFRNGEPILARPTSVWERGMKWARRRPAVAGLLTALILVVTGALVGIATLWLRAEEQRDAATQARGDAEEQRDAAQQAQQAAETAKEKLDDRLARLSVSQGLQHLEEGDLLGSLPAFTEALKRQRPGSEREQVNRQRLAAILRQCPRIVQLWPHEQAVHCAAFSLDGHRVVTGCADGTARVWDLATGRPTSPPLMHTGLVQDVAFSPDGRLVVTASLDQTACLWDVTTEASAAHPIATLKHGGAVRRARFSPDGRRVVTASDDRKARLWDVAGQQATVFLGHDAEVWHAAFSPDGRRVVTANLDHTARVWDAATGEQIGSDLEHRNDVWYAAFSPDGRRLVTASLDQTARVWQEQGNTWRRVASLEHAGGVIYATFSPDGHRVLTAGLDQKARIWDADTGAPLTRPLEHGHYLNLAVFSPDGRRVLTASQDATARVWDATSGQPLTPPLKHGGNVRQAAFSPDGCLVLTSGDDRIARVWDLPACEPDVPLIRHGGGVNQVSFSKGGLRIVTASDDSTARVWDAATGQPISPPLRHDGRVFTAVFGPEPEGRRVITASADGTARVWDADTGRPITPPLKHGAPVYRAAFSPDGRLVATAGSNRGARLWDAVTGRPLTPLLTPDNQDTRQRIKKPEAEAQGNERADDRRVVRDLPILPLIALQAVVPQVGPVQPIEPTTPAPAAPSAGATGLAAPSAEHAPISRMEELLLMREFQVEFGPRGRRFITATSGQTAQVWDLTDAADGVPRALPLKHTRTVHHAEFSPDGNRLLTVAGGDALIWDVTNQELPRLLPLKHTGLVYSAAFSPDGQRVVTTSNDRTTRIWAADSGKQVIQPLKHVNAPHDAVFSSDGRWVLTTTLDEGRVWDVATGEPVTPPLRHGGLMTCAALSPDCCRVVTAGADGSVRVWVLPARDTRPTDNLAILAEVLASRTIKDSGDFMPSEPTALRNAYQTLRTSYPDAFTVSAEQQLAWHRRQADESERQALAAAWCNKLTPHKPRESIARPDEGGPPRADAPPLEAQLRAGIAQPDEGALLRALKLQVGKADVHWFAAASHLTRLLEAEPTGALYVRRARAHSELGAWQNAENDLAKALAIDPKAEQPDALFLQGRAWAHLGRWDDAAASFAKALELAPQDGGAICLARSMVFSQRPNQEQARACLAEAVERSKAIRLGSDRRWGKRCQSVAEAARWEAVIADLSSIIRRDAEAQWAWRDRGLAHAALGQWWEAREDFQAALGMNSKPKLVEKEIPQRKSTDVDSWRGLARASAELGDWHTALLACSEALKLAKEDTSAWYLRGIVQSQLGRYDQAILDYSSASRRGANGRGIRAERGRAHAALGQWLKAATDLTKAIDPGEDDEEVLSWAALAYLATGDTRGYGRACKALLEPAGKIPDLEAAHRLLRVCVLHPDALSDGADRARLVRLAEGVLAAEPENRAYRATLGAALYRDGQFAKAIEKLTKVTAPEPAPKREKIEKPKEGQEEEEAPEEPGPQVLEPGEAPKGVKPPREAKPFPAGDRELREKDPPPGGTAFDWLFLAMAYHQSKQPKHKEEARQWLDQALRWLEAAKQEESPPLPWDQRLALQVLRREAQDLLKDEADKPPAEPRPK
jgi:WD40 repeat protein/tetratricopeptide (TPR) repeat protein